MISNVFKCRKCSEQMWKHCEAWTFTRTYKKDVKACCNSWCQCQSALRSGCAGQDTQRMTLFNLSTSKWSKLCFASITSIFAASSRRRPSTRTSCHSHSGVGTEKKKNLHISTLSYYPTMWNFRQSERGPGAGRVIIQPPSPRIDTQNHALHSEQCTICGISPGHWKNLENAHEISRDPTESIGDFADSVACCCLLLPVACSYWDILHSWHWASRRQRSLNPLFAKIQENCGECCHQQPLPSPYPILLWATRYRRDMNTTKLFARNSHHGLSDTFMTVWLA